MHFETVSLQRTYCTKLFDTRRARANFNIVWVHVDVYVTSCIYAFPYKQTSKINLTKKY